MFNRSFSAVFFFVMTMAIATTAMAQTWGPCPERPADTSVQCLYAGTAPAVLTVAPSRPAPATAATSTTAATAVAPTTIPWGWIVLGLIVVGAGMYGWRHYRIEREVALSTVENAVISAWLVAQRATAQQRAMTWALVSRWRHLHPGQPILTNGQVGVDIEPHVAHIAATAPFDVAAPAPAPNP